MTEKPSGILMLITQQIIEVYRPIVKAVGEALHKLAEVIDEIGDDLADTQEREKDRAYEHLITPPRDHTTVHVTHTSTKPPHPARIYRRRTP